IISGPITICGSADPLSRAPRILGDSFLRTFYTAYNVEDKTVGLAR
ncbi:unnamed protein product, partial [Ectocarpus sp. 12 AP-2014]